MDEVNYVDLMDPKLNLVLSHLSSMYIHEFDYVDIHIQLYIL